jgi:hypothetical protein
MSDARTAAVRFRQEQMATLFERERSGGVSFLLCVSDPDAVDDLVEFVERAACPAARLLAGEVAVLLENAAETPTELVFALNAWQRSFPDVTVEIRQAA